MRKGSYNYPAISERERIEKHNRQIYLIQEFKETLSRSQRQYLERANRTSRVEKTSRRSEKSGMTAFTATLRHETTSRLNQVPKGLKSANLEVLIARGWLWGQLWQLIHELNEELAISKAHIKYLNERGEEE